MSRIEGQDVYRCRNCHDTGWAQVIDPVYWPKSLRSVAVVCGCDQGDKVANWRANRESRPVARLNKSMAAYVPGMNREDAAAAIADAQRVENRDNYTDFGDYSAEKARTF